MPPSFHQFASTIGEDLGRLLVFGKCEHFVRDKFLIYLKENIHNAFFGKEVTLSDLNSKCDPFRPDIVARYHDSQDLHIWQFKAAAKPNTLSLSAKMLSDYETTREGINGINFRYYGVGWAVINPTNMETMIPPEALPFYDRNITRMFSTNFNDSSVLPIKEKIRNRLSSQLEIEFSQLSLKNPAFEQSINLLIVTANA